MMLAGTGVAFIIKFLDLQINQYFYKKGICI